MIYWKSVKTTQLDIFPEFWCTITIFLAILFCLKHCHHPAYTHILTIRCCPKCVVFPQPYYNIDLESTREKEMERIKAILILTITVNK